MKIPKPFDAAAARLMALTGWRANLFDLLLGALVPLALPPSAFWPLILIIFPALLCRLVAAENWRAAVMTGWLFGFGQFFFGLYWIGSAFMVEAEMFLWALPFAVTLLPAGLALFPLLAALLFYLLTRYLPLCRRDMAAAALMLIICLSVAAWLRGHVLTGFPWGLYGMASLGWMPLAQAAHYWGIYGQTVMILLLAFLPLLAAVDRRLGRGLALVFLVLVVDGYLKLNQADQPPLASPAADAPVGVRIVQPAIPQREKWRPQNRTRVIEAHLNLTRQLAEAPVHIVVWPETALPALLDSDDWLRGQIAAALPQQSVLVTGALRRQEADETERGYHSFNSVFVMDHQGAITAGYDKHHLVPFGEYLPMQQLLEKIGLQQLTRLRGGFSAGQQPRTLSLPRNLPTFSPLVCYEVIFPSEVVANPRPAFIVNVTNDGWFGRSAGPWQHLAQARMRSIEQGLPMIRAANTGVSAVIDAYGQVQAQLPLMAAGVIDHMLPPARPPGLYARYGDLGFLLMLAVLLGLIACRPKG